MNSAQIRPSDLEMAIAESVEKSKPTDSSDDEACDLERNRERLLSEQIKDIVHYRVLRGKYGNRVFVFMCIWSGLTFALLLLKGFLGQQFELNDSVLVTLTGGTTVSVIGLVGFIVQGLFNSTHSQKPK